jgi:hypothetical protein
MAAIRRPQDQAEAYERRVAVVVVHPLSEPLVWLILLVAMAEMVPPTRLPEAASHTQAAAAAHMDTSPVRLLIRAALVEVVVAVTVQAAQVMQHRDL